MFRVAFIGLIQCRRRNIIAASPDMYLLFAKFLSHLSLVQTLQISIVTLIKLPGIRDRNPFEIHFLQDHPKGLDGTPQNRRVCHIENIAAFFQ
jgi:hypothetical protein